MDKRYKRKPWSWSWMGIYENSFCQNYYQVFTYK